MDKQLYTGLNAQRVNFNDNYHNWTKQMMIQKILTVMGIDGGYDPDPTYVLTVDNLIKILAIQMRFRHVILFLLKCEEIKCVTCTLIQVLYSSGNNG